MNPLMNSVGSNAEGKLNCINAVVITHKTGTTSSRACFALKISPIFRLL